MRKSFDGPLSIFAAHGFGRSYGLEAGCFGKKFPGIFFSGLWPALRSEKSAPTTALLTDIGNDLGYEVPVERIIEWILGCVERLQELKAKIVLTDLPIDTLRGVGEVRFRFFRSLFFPSCRLGRAELIGRAAELSAALHALAESHKIPIFAARNKWYGLDPIHPRRSHLPGIWQQLLGAEPDVVSPSSAARDPWTLHWRLRRLKPESWSHFSLSRRANQPCGRLSDGSTIALY